MSEELRIAVEKKHCGACRSKVVSSSDKYLGRYKNLIGSVAIKAWNLDFPSKQTIA